MMWSKLKQRVEDRFSDNLHGRLKIYETRQRMGHNHNLGEIWLTLDKERIFSTSDMKGWQRVQAMLQEGRSYSQAFDKTAAEGTLPVYQSNALLFDSLSMTVEEMLVSNSVLIRGLAIADKRCRRRRLEKVETDLENEHEFIQRIFLARAQRQTNSVNCKVERETID